MNPIESIDPYTAYQAFSETLRQHYRRLHVMLEEIHIYPGQPPLLFLLEREDGLSQKVLAQKINIKPSTLTTMLKCMEGSGIVEKVQDQEDKRIFRVFLTEKGKSTVEKARRIMRNLSDELFQGFDGDQLLSFYHMMKKMKQNIRD